MGHIGTTLDAQYVGCSLIAIHNHSKERLKLKVGAEFVTIQFWYLNTPDYPGAVTHDNEPGHPRVLNGYSVQNYIEWRDKNPWAARKNNLYTKMYESDEFQRCKDEYQMESNNFNHGILKSETKKKIKIIVSLIVVCVIICIPSYLIDLGGFSTIIKDLSGKIIFPVLMSIITVQFIDKKKKVKD